MFVVTENGIKYQASGATSQLVARSSRRNLPFLLLLLDVGLVSCRFLLPHSPLVAAIPEGVD